MIDADELIKRGHAGEITSTDMLNQLLDAEVFVPSATQLGDSLDDLQPMMFERDGVVMVASFTKMEFVLKHRDMSKHLVRIKVWDVLKALKPDYGFSINPDEAYGFEMKPEVLQHVRRLRAN
jgi:hypothetical protein